MPNKKYITIRISGPVWKRVKAEKMLRNSQSLDEALKELINEFDSKTDRKKEIKDMFHL